jgi:uncharacterized protein (TIGR02145 family)
MLNNLKIAPSDIGTANHNLSNPNINFSSLASLASPSNSSGSDDFAKPKYYDPTCGQTGSFYGDCDSSSGDITSDHFYGYLYNWCAAMGATTRACTASNTYPTDLAGNAANTGSYDPTNTASICPAGWRLPTGGVHGDFTNLDIFFGGTGSLSSNSPSIARWNFTGPFRGVFSSYWYMDFYSQGGYADLWSSSAHPSYSDDAFGLYFGSGDVNPLDVDFRATGRAVRCLLRP